MLASGGAAWQKKCVLEISKWWNRTKKNAFDLFIYRVKMS